MDNRGYEAVIGLEIHAELETRSKMFCGCQVVDSITAAPNTAVCPICAGMPGVLPVVNQQAVAFALRVALALDCQIALTSIFARKNYFYPDLPKGYQISQYEQPLARHGRLTFITPRGERTVRIRRVHLEEDTGKLTHVERDSQAFSLIDLNRAGVPLLEIVSEPDLHSGEEVRLYSEALHSLLRYLGVSSGDMQRGILRIEPNVSVRQRQAEGEVSAPLGTRTEIKNLNSFRALERAVAFEINRQSEILERGQAVVQETRGWNEAAGVTVAQRSKEEAHDYRYFPEPDLPPLTLETEYIQQARAALPELPLARYLRFQSQYGLSAYDAGTLTAERPVADYYEQVAANGIPPKIAANWVSGELFGLLNQAGLDIDCSRVKSDELAGLLRLVIAGEINQNTAKTVLGEMFTSGRSAQEIVAARGLRQVSDGDQIAALVHRVLIEHPDQIAAYLSGKETIARWLFGQVMRLAHGQANPQVVQVELDRQLLELKSVSKP
jgi:aspartyl-tRNA(Asn)/glutamyl-tRNA(Gln) amidotransferase subunit B